MNGWATDRASIIVDSVGVVIDGGLIRCNRLLHDGKRGL